MIEICMSKSAFGGGAEWGSKSLRELSVLHEIV